MPARKKKDDDFKPPGLFGSIAPAPEPEVSPKPKRAAGKRVSTSQPGKPEPTAPANKSKAGGGAGHRVIEARFASICKLCGRRIEAGEQIKYYYAERKAACHETGCDDWLEQMFRDLSDEEYFALFGSRYVEARR